MVPQGHFSASYHALSPYHSFTTLSHLIIPSHNFYSNRTSPHEFHMYLFSFGVCNATFLMFHYVILDNQIYPAIQFTYTVL